MKGGTKERLCIACRQYAPREMLIRFTNTPEGVKVNGGPNVFGRSAYLCRNTACVDRAIEKHLLSKSLKSPVDDAILYAIREELLNG